MKLAADMHTHTVASTHAYSTITENCRAAAELGLRALAITDHYLAMPDSPHEWHFKNLRALPRSIMGVDVIRGAEVNIIDYEGRIDAPESILRELEWVVASYHRYMFPDFKPADPETVTKGYIKLCRNPYVDVIGHPTTDLFPIDYEEAVKAFKEYDKLVEVNESSILNKKGSSKNIVPLLLACKKYGVRVVVDSDAHFWSAVGNTPTSLRILSELDFPEKLVVNACWESLRERILAKHPNFSL